MSITPSIHTIQTEILKALLFHPRLRFSELNGNNTPSDQFSFHIKRLTELGLISKDEGNGFYSLTDAGKEFTNRLDTDVANPIYEKQAKIGVLIGCVRDDIGGARVLNTRKNETALLWIPRFHHGQGEIGRTNY